MLLLWSYTMSSILAPSKFIDNLVEKFNGWLSSRGGFVQAVIFTLIWVPLVVYKVDPHGFIYLYIATAFSTITQFSVAIIAFKAKIAGDKANEGLIQMLENQVSTMQFLVELAKEIHKEQEEQTEILEVIQDEIGDI